MYDCDMIRAQDRHNTASFCRGSTSRRELFGRDQQSQIHAHSVGDQPCHNLGVRFDVDIEQSYQMWVFRYHFFCNKRQKFMNSGRLLTKQALVYKPPAH